MADEDTLTEEERAEVFAESLEDSGVREHDDNYVGASPDSMHSAYETDAPVVDNDEDPDIDMRVRVKEHEEAMAQPQSEIKAFQEWVGERQTGAGGPGSSRVTKSGPSAPAEDAESEASGDARTLTSLRQRASELDIPGRSSMDYDELLAAVEAAEA